MANRQYEANGDARTVGTNISLIGTDTVTPGRRRIPAAADATNLGGGDQPRGRVGRPGFVWLRLQLPSCPLGSPPSSEVKNKK